VGATHLLPQAETEHKKYSFFALGAGILMALVIIFSRDRSVVRIFSFNSHHRRYEVWFSRPEATYLSGLFAIRALLP